MRRMALSGHIRRCAAQAAASDQKQMLAASAQPPGLSGGETAAFEGMMSKSCPYLEMAPRRLPIPRSTFGPEPSNARILTAACWCFLNFGFAKTAFEDIAKRANLSRTLLYRIFKDKEEIYQAVFVDWLISRHPAAKQAAEGPGRPYERLLSVCRLMALEPWGEMVGAPMGPEFLEVCERIDPPK